MTPGLRTTIRKVYIYRALIDFILLYPFYSIFFANHGLSTAQISTLFVIWSLTGIVANVPLGVLADNLSRKWLLVIGPLIEVIGFLTWLRWPTFSGFAFGFILWGVSWAMVDITFRALLFDELKTAHIDDQYVRIAGRAQSFAQVANFAATALASLAILLGYGFVTAGSIAALLLASLIALTLRSSRRHEKVADPHYFGMLKASIMETVQNKILLEIILLGSVIGAVYGTLDEYVPLFFHQIGYSRPIVSLVVAATILVGALGSFLAHRYERLGASGLMLLLLLCGGLLIGSAQLLGISSIVLIILFTFAINLLYTIYDGKVQHAITGKLRATVTSVSIFGIELFSVIAFILYGVAARRTGNIAGFKIIGIIAIGTGLAYLVFTPRLLTKRIKQDMS